MIKNEIRDKLEIKLENLKQKLTANIDINDFITSEFVKNCSKNISINSAYPYFQSQHVDFFFKLNNKILEKKIALLKSKIENQKIDNNTIATVVAVDTTGTAAAADTAVAAVDIVAGIVDNINTAATKSTTRKLG